MIERIVTVIVTYNRKKLLAECIQAVKEQSVNTDIIVIDNASTDGTDKLKELYTDKVFYYNTGKNIGGAGGFNYGLRKAYEAGYEHIWIMDDDTVPEKTALEKLVRVAKENKDYGFLAGRVLWTDGNDCLMNRPGLVKGATTGEKLPEAVSGDTLSQKKVLHDEKLQDKSLEIKEYIPAEWATFVSLLIRREVLEVSGLPIKEFFIWGDDREYTKRVSADYNSYYVPESIVIHKMKNNSGSDISLDAFERIDRYVYAFRNEYYTAVHGKNKFRDICGYYRYVMGTIKAIILLSPDYKWKRIATVLKGMCKGWFFNPKVEKMVQSNIN